MPSGNPEEVVHSPMCARLGELFSGEHFRSTPIFFHFLKLIEDGHFQATNALGLRMDSS